MAVTRFRQNIYDTPIYHTLDTLGGWGRPNTDDAFRTCFNQQFDSVIYVLPRFEGVRATQVYYDVEPAPDCFRPAYRML